MSAENGQKLMKTERKRSVKSSGNNSEKSGETIINFFWKSSL